MRRSHTAVVERNVVWTGQYATEPYEAAWASEALFFVRALAAENVVPAGPAQVQISPDGIHWCNEGTTLMLPDEPGLQFCRVTEFGGWLRLAGELPDDASLRVLVYLVLKE